MSVIRAWPDDNRLEWRRMDLVLPANSRPRIPSTFATLAGNKVYVTGRLLDFDNKHFNLFVLDLSVRRWRHMAVRGPFGFVGHSVSLVNDALYVFGGWVGPATTARLSNEVYRFDMALEELMHVHAEGSLRPRKIAHHSGCYVESLNQLVVFGGYTGNGYIKDLFAFDVKSARWIAPKQKGELPEYGLSTMAFCAVGNNVYYYGGYNGNGVIDGLYILNCTRRCFTWSLLKPPEGAYKPFALKAATLSYVRGKLLLFGGSYNLHHRVSVFDLDERKWLPAGGKVDPNVEEGIHVQGDESDQYHTAIATARELWVFAGYDAVFSTVRVLREN